jgi:hypothetical protein
MDVRLETKADVLKQAFTEQSEGEDEVELVDGSVKIRSTSPFHNTISYFEDRSSRQNNNKTYTSHDSRPREKSNRLQSLIDNLREKKDLKAAGKSHRPVLKPLPRKTSTIILESQTQKQEIMEKIRRQMTPKK